MKRSKGMLAVNFAKASGGKAKEALGYSQSSTGGLLTRKEFIEATIQRIGETGRANWGAKKRFLVCEIEPERLGAAVEKVYSVFCFGAAPRSRLRSNTCDQVNGSLRPRRRVRSGYPRYLPDLQWCG